MVRPAKSPAALHVRRAGAGPSSVGPSRIAGSRTIAVFRKLSSERGLGGGEGGQCGRRAGDLECQPAGGWRRTAAQIRQDVRIGYRADRPPGSLLRSVQSGETHAAVHPGRRQPAPRAAHRPALAPADRGSARHPVDRATRRSERRRTGPCSGCRTPRPPLPPARGVLPPRRARTRAREALERQVWPEHCRRGSPGGRQ